MLLENNGYPFDSRVRREAESLAEAGYWVGVVAPREQGEARRERIRGVEVYRFPAPPGGSGVVSFVWEYAASTLLMGLFTAGIWLKHRFRVIHAHNPPDVLWFIAIFFKIFGVRFVFDHHDLSAATYASRFGSGERGPVFNTLKFMEKASCKLADAVIATNQSYRRVDIEENGVDAERVFIVRNGPTDSFNAVDPDAELAARAPNTVGYVGTMGPQDGVDYLLRAAHRLRHDLGRDDFQVVIIGSGDALEDLRKLSGELELDDFVWFTGRIPYEDLLRYLSTATICAQPDPSNPLNDKSTMNKIMEYMALSKPIVAFDLVETRFSAGDSALYATPNDELDFARKLAELMDDPDRRQQMGAAGKRRLEEELAWRHSVPHLLAAYESLGVGQAPAR